MRTLYKYGTEIVTVAAIALLWLIGALIFQNTVPQYDFGWPYHLIPVIFLIFALISMVLADGWEHEVEEGDMPRESVVTKYMIFKGVKMGVCILLIVAYWLISAYRFNSFLLTFLLFYIISLVTESLMFVRLQNRIDKYSARQKKDKNVE